MPDTTSPPPPATDRTGWDRHSLRIERWNPNQWLLFWFIWSLLISAIYWILGPHSYLRIQDNADFNVPYRMAAARDLLEWGITYWQPRFSGGMPAWVHPQIDSFLVNGPLFLIFPAWLAYGFIMWLQRFLAGYFTFRLCREVLKLNPIGALFAGLAFSLYLWNIRDWTLYTGLGLPATALILLLFNRLLGQPPVRAMIGAFFLGLLVSLSAPSVLYTAFLLGGLPFWFWIVQQSPWRKLLPRFATFTLGVVTAAAPSLIALLTYSPFTTRGQLATATETPPDINPFIILGDLINDRLLPEQGLHLSLLVLGLLIARNPAKPVVWRLLTAFLAVVFGSELLTMAQNLSGDLFPTSRGNLRDVYQLTTFIGPLLGGVGLHLIWEYRHNRTGWQRGGLLLMTLAILALPVMNWLEVSRQLLHRLSTDNYAVNFQDPLLTDLANRRQGFPFRVATVGAWPPRVTAASGDRLYPAYLQGYGLETVDGYYRLHSARYHRFWRRVIAKTLNARPNHDYRTSKWYYLFKPPEQRFASRTPIVLKEWFNPNLLSLANTRYLLSHWPLAHPSLTPLHTPEKELATGQAWQKLRLRKKIGRTLHGEVPGHALYLYENRSVLPRAYLVTGVKRFADHRTLLDALSTTPAERLRSTAFIQRDETPATLKTTSPLSPGRVTFVRYEPDHLTLHSDSDGPGLLVVTNTYDPFWKVTVNGEAGELFPVYHTFQGIPLPAGRNTITLDYWPPYRLF